MNPTAHTISPLEAPFTTPSKRHQRLRRTGAIAAGFATIVVASTAVDSVLHATGVYPPLGHSMSSGLFALATAYRLIIAIAGSYLTARLSPGRPLADALILGAIGTVVSTAGAIAMWDAGPGWYPLGLIATALPCAWLGARLFLRGAK
ncbi:MAG TPA: hypothetical protein VGF45_20880 [Polyangia bacterium]